MMKKMRKNGSYLSMENLDIGDDENQSDSIDSDTETQKPKRKKSSSC